MISILHATARPKHWIAACGSWLGKAASRDGVEYVLACNDRYFSELPRPDEHLVVISFDGRRGPVAGWNEAAEISRGSILVRVTDDFFPCERWDEAILGELPDTSLERVLWVSRGTDADPVVVSHIEFPILTRRYYLRYGYLEHPSYFAYYADNDFTDRAQRDGVVIDKRREIKFIHLRHPWGEDAPIQESMQHWHEDQANYARRKLAGFPS